ncbi:branched-chain amino acid ABC transporter permease [Salinarimonas rosea]|uniref:branched-chain amino acid ABC transporter permease n=1 Tax=Salinarimonas rosea TaxID=552063 RepID=UPI0003F4C705|nr:branched-chain amino acid ABC transporter permease [Salinarimonas rosea]
MPRRGPSALRRAGSPRAGVLLAGLLLLALAGCMPAVDPGQALVCRTVLVALHPEGTHIEVLREIGDADARGVAIVYRVAEPGAPPRRASTACRFGAERTLPGGRDLVSVTHDGVALSPVRLFLLERYWTGKGADAAATAPPRPSALAGEGLPLGRGGVQALQVGLAALTTGSLYGLLAVAYSLVYGLVGRIFLAFGEIAIVGGYAVAIAVGVALATSGLAGEAAVYAGLALGLVLAPLATASLARLLAEGVVAPLAHRPGYAMLVASFGLVIALSEGLRLVQGGSEIWIAPGRVRGVVLATTPDGALATITLTQGAAIALALAGALAAIVLVARSRFGRAWRAVSDDPDAAALMGVDARATLVGAVTLAGVLAALAGWFVVAHYGNISFAGGLMLGLKALVAAILGGIGSLPGALLGGLLLGLGESLWSAFLPGAYRDVAVFGALALLLALRPGGLLGDAHPGVQRV